MAMGAPIRTSMATPPMPTDPKLLTLIQWLSPSYPLGAFAFSHGLETAVSEGWISDGTQLENWLRDCITDGSGRTDAIWIRLAMATSDLAALDVRARAYIPARERLREADRQGAAFAATTNAVWGLDLPDVLLPLAVGGAAARVGLDAEPVVQLYLQAFVSNLVSAALRLAPIGQTEGQRIIFALQSDCLHTAQETSGAGEDDIFSNTFRSDIAAMRHETLEPRIFQS